MSLESKMMCLDRYSKGLVSSSGRKGSTDSQDLIRGPKSRCSCPRSRRISRAMARSRSSNLSLPTCLTRPLNSTTSLFAESSSSLLNTTNIAIRYNASEKNIVTFELILYVIFQIWKNKSLTECEIVYFL